MWRALEPYHAVTYFAPESKAATDELGCKGYWMSYFGMRAAPLGAAQPELVTALFYNFHPAHVARAVPDVWVVAPPERFLQARRASVDAALRRLIGTAVDGPELAEAAELAREAALAAPLAGRPLAAANAALEWPERPHLVLWQAQTVLRESRGDGHVAALITAGLEPAEALVVFVIDAELDADRVRQRRGWSEPEWAVAVERLQARGLLDSDGALTADGVELRAWVEQCTDEGAAPSWQALGTQRSERLVELMAPVVRAIIAGDGLMLGNPMGLRPLV